MRNEKLRNWISSYNSFWVIKSTRPRWTGYVTLVEEMRDANQKPFWVQPLGR